jgi:hypothetical protein
MTGGSLQALRPFVNVANDDDFRLVIAWIFKAMFPIGPTPILVVIGEPGGCKSTFLKVVRRLLDPNVAPLRLAPRSERDLFISAGRSWLVAFDNISRVNNDLSDAICSLITGGGYATRALFSDDDECIFHLIRPVMMNSTVEPTDRDDFLERSVVIRVPPLPRDARKTEALFWENFDAQAPAILGALLTALGEAMGQISGVQANGLPRMADFARLAIAAEPSLGWSAGGFMETCQRQRLDADDAVLEGSPIGAPLMKLLTVGGFRGSCEQLLKQLGAHLGPVVRSPQRWPSTPRGMRSELNRIAPALRRKKVEVFFERTANERIVILVPQTPKPRIPKCLSDTMPVGANGPYSEHVDQT